MSTSATRVQPADAPRVGLANEGDGQERVCELVPVAVAVHDGIQHADADRLVRCRQLQGVQRLSLPTLAVVPEHAFVHEHPQYQEDEERIAHPNRLRMESFTSARSFSDRRPAAPGFPPD